MTDNLKDSIIRYLNTEYDDIPTFIHKDKPRSVFHIRDLKTLFEYDETYRWIGIGSDVWEMLENFMGLEYHDVSLLLIEWFSNKHKVEVTQCHHIKKSHWWELAELSYTNELHGYPQLSTESLFPQLL
jgi:hypothetical protein